VKKYNYIASACFIALGCYVLYETGTYEVSGVGQGNPAIWPRILAVSMIVFSAALILTTALRKEDAQETTRKADPDAAPVVQEEDAGQVTDWKSAGMKKVYQCLATVAIFIAVMNLFGMFIGLLVLIPGVMWLMNCRNKKMLVILPVGMVLFVYVFFVKLLTITLPGGLFF